jgi:hypothetical protein
MLDVKKSVLSAAIRTLEDRIVKIVSEHFQRPVPKRAKTKEENEDAEHGIILAVAWDLLLIKFRKLTPEKSSAGVFVLGGDPMPRKSGPAGEPGCEAQ